MEKRRSCEYIEACLIEEEQTYNSVQLARKLKQERAVNLSSDRLSSDMLQKSDRFMLNFLILLFTHKIIDKGC
ncbi:hypothetical protein [Pleurocapsa sp. CCALA 161]|uniref:hypothetical protein n=1 Tax=Pleurocapsa sp. CCALA 161 TaxID=2107688 RepID=UPI0011B1D9B9|nr:hypothetical protein [Pleurocapsa sp. CCALA 161]